MAPTGDRKGIQSRRLPRDMSPRHPTRKAGVGGGRILASPLWVGRGPSQRLPKSMPLWEVVHGPEEVGAWGTSGPGGGLPQLALPSLGDPKRQVG